MADFYVATDRLATTAGRLQDVTGQVSAIAKDAAVVTAGQAALGRIAEAATFYSALRSSVKASAKELDEAERRLTFISSGAKNCAAEYAKADEQASQIYRQAVTRR